MMRGRCQDVDKRGQAREYFLGDILCSRHFGRRRQAGLFRRRNANAAYQNDALISIHTPEY